MIKTIFLSLVLAGNFGVWNFLARNPGSVDARSIRILFVRGLLPCAAVLVFLFLCWGAGRRLLRLFVLRRLSSPLSQLLAAGFGLGIAAAGIFIFGIIGALNTWGISVLLTLLALSGVPDNRRRFDPGAQTAPKTAEPAESWPAWKRAVAAVLAFSAFNALILALAPPAEWDILAYHLALPKLYAAAERVQEIPWLIHAHWPHLMEILYSLPFGAGADNGAALLHAAVCALWGAGVYQIARDEMGREASWIAAALLACQPLVLRFAGTAHADGGLALFHLLSGVCLWRWSQGQDAGWLLVAGVFSGLAASCKLHGLILAAALAAWVLRRTLISGRKDLAKNILTFALPAAAVAGPWYLKTWIGTGNPVWPFFSGLFGGQWGAQAIEAPFLASSRWGWPPSMDLITRYGAQYFLVAALGLWALAWELRKPLPGIVKLLLWPIPFYLPFVIRQHEAWRFMLALTPGLALAGAFGASEALKAGGKRALLAGALGAFGMIPIMSATQNNELFAVLGLSSPREPDKDPRDLYLEKTLDHYAFYKEAPGVLPPGSRVLLFREIRGYYLDARYQWGDPVNQGLIAYDAMRGPEELSARLRELGITHVLVNEGLAIYGPSPGYYTPRTLALMEDFLRAETIPVLRRGALALHALSLPPR